MSLEAFESNNTPEIQEKDYIDRVDPLVETIISESFHIPYETDMIDVQWYKTETTEDGEEIEVKRKMHAWVHNKPYIFEDKLKSGLPYYETRYVIFTPSGSFATISTREYHNYQGANIHSDYARRIQNDPAYTGHGISLRLKLRPENFGLQEKKGQEMEFKFHGYGSNYEKEDYRGFTEEPIMNQFKTISRDRAEILMRLISEQPKGLYQEREIVI